MASTDSQLQHSCKNFLIDKEIRSEPLCKYKKFFNFHIYHSLDLVETFKFRLKKSDELKWRQMAFKVENMGKSCKIEIFNDERFCHIFNFKSHLTPFKHVRFSKMELKSLNQFQRIIYMKIKELFGAFFLLGFQ